MINGSARWKSFLMPAHSSFVVAAPDWLWLLLPPAELMALAPPPVVALLPRTEPGSLASTGSLGSADAGLDSESTFENDGAVGGDGGRDHTEVTESHRLPRQSWDEPREAERMGL